MQDQLHKISAAPEVLDLYLRQIVNVLTEAIQKFVPVASHPHIQNDGGPKI